MCKKETNQMDQKNTRTKSTFYFAIKESSTSVFRHCKQIPTREKQRNYDAEGAQDNRFCYVKIQIK